MAESSVMLLTEAKVFYIARFLSPVQFDIRGGGGSGAVIAARWNTSTSTANRTKRASGAAGGYVTITEAVDVAGKLIRVIPGAGGAPASITSAPSSGGYKTASGSRGGTTTVYVDDQSYSASGGAGGVLNSSEYNTDGGADGGAGVYRVSIQIGTGNSADGKDGRNLFDDTAQEKKGSGGGGAYVSWDASSESDHTVRSGPGGSGGGTSGSASTYTTSDAVSSDDATTAGGSGSVVYAMGTSSGPISSGKGGPGFVAFRKAV